MIRPARGSDAELVQAFDVLCDRVTTWGDGDLLLVDLRGVDFRAPHGLLDGDGLELLDPGHATEHVDDEDRRRAGRDRRRDGRGRHRRQ